MANEKKETSSTPLVKPVKKAKAAVKAKVVKPIEAVKVDEIKKVEAEAVKVDDLNQTKVEAKIETKKEPIVVEVKKKVELPIEYIKYNPYVMDRMGVKKGSFVDKWYSPIKYMLMIILAIIALCGLVQALYVQLTTGSLTSTFGLKAASLDATAWGAAAGTALNIDTARFVDLQYSNVTAITVFGFIALFTILFSAVFKKGTVGSLTMYGAMIVELFILIALLVVISNEVDFWMIRKQVDVLNNAGSSPADVKNASLYFMNILTNVTIG